MPALGSLYDFPIEWFSQLRSASLGGSEPNLDCEKAAATAAGDRPSLPLPSAPDPSPLTTNATDLHSSSATVSSASAAATTGCIACSVEHTFFDDQHDQRAHFGSDWHRKNVKRRQLGKTPLAEQEFEAMLDRQDDDVSSISGSSSEDEDLEVSQPIGTHRTAGSPKEYFIASDGQHIGLWRCLLTAEPSCDASTAVSAVNEMRLRPPKWCIVLSSGGHFAAAVFALPPATESGQSQKPKSQQSQLQVTAHRTFHRYVVRAKAGGRQSTQDNTGKFAKSAGSQIRRENEAHLTADVNATLKEFSTLLGPRDLIFVQASGINSAAIFGGKDAPLSRSDSRIRRIPFPIRRPTFAESKRVVRLLATVFLEERLQPARAIVHVGDGAARPSQPSTDSGPCSQATAVVGAQSELGQQSNDDATEEHVPQPRLHRAAAAGDADKVSFLLMSGQDPALKDSRGRPPYLVAANKAVRDTFRRFMATQPDAWDYGAAAIPSALTEEMEQHQDARAADKRAKQRAREKVRKKAMAEKRSRQAEKDKVAAAAEIEAAAEAAASSASKTAGVRMGMRAPTPSQKQVLAKQAKEDQEAEERARRRERAAAAAEARMQAITLASQQQQLHH